MGNTIPETGAGVDQQHLQPIVEREEAKEQQPTNNDWDEMQRNQDISASSVTRDYPRGGEMQQNNNTISSTIQNVENPHADFTSDEGEESFETIRITKEESCGEPSGVYDRHSVQPQTLAENQRSVTNTETQSHADANDKSAAFSQLDEASRHLIRKRLQDRRERLRTNRQGEYRDDFSHQQARSGWDERDSTDEERNRVARIRDALYQRGPVSNTADSNTPATTNTHRSTPLDPSVGERMAVGDDEIYTNLEVNEVTKSLSLAIQDRVRRAPVDPVPDDPSLVPASVGGKSVFSKRSKSTQDKTTQQSSTPVVTGSDSDSRGLTKTKINNKEKSNGVVEEVPAIQYCAFSEEDLERFLLPTVSRTSLRNLPIDENASQEFVDQDLSKNTQNLPIEEKASKECSGQDLSQSTQAKDQWINEATQSDDEHYDMTFIRNYQSFFNKFLRYNRGLVAENPELIETLRVAKLQRLLEDSIQVESALENELSALRTDNRINHYHSQVTTALNDKAALEVSLARELRTAEEATRVMEGRLTWQTIETCYGSSKKEKMLREKLLQNNDASLFESLPDHSGSEAIRGAVRTTTVTDDAEEQDKHVRQLQVGNAFLHAEAKMLEKTLDELRARAKKYAWVDSVFLRLGPNEMKELGDQYGKKLGVQL